MSRSRGKSGAFPSIILSALLLSAVLHGCGDDDPEAEVDGLYIGSFDTRDGQTLDDLRGVAWVTGDLIVRATRVSTLEPLQHLAQVGGNLSIEGNSELRDLDALSNLERAEHEHGTGDPPLP